MRDPLGYRLKVGVVTPSTNTIVQPEYEAMRPTGVTNHVARILVPEAPIDGDEGFTELVAVIDDALDDAVRRIVTCEPDRISLGVSIEAVWGGGVQAAKALEQRLRGICGDIPIHHAAEAIPAALAALGCDSGSLGVVTPYMPVAHSHIADFFSETGYEVIAATHLERGSPIDIAYTPERDLLDALEAVDAKQPDAIVQFGANLCMARLAGEAEHWLNKPVVAVNTATYWHTLRSAGIDDRIDGFGSLLLDH